MWHHSMFLGVLLIGGLAGCGASASTAAGSAREAQAASSQAEASAEHARLVQLEARLTELEHRLASQSRACEATPDGQAGDVANSRDPRDAQPLRSEGDFLAEAHAVTTAAPPAKLAARGAPAAARPALEQQRLEQLLDMLRDYGLDAQGGLSPERREALRVLLRRERQLDLMNPWNGR